eukprot:NODE_3112_length_1045_cov_20.852410_g2859_i0.p2 GENE.NODE_3112_length_1045_cov_20.852410_g2859_i0~~NODE_3112_length_1045_cov_20.852410_g2859_i0.p2  ORF type:complete len:240 (+),score=28.17 NODE_3112_length_1045_cov_20.852410_g2859_i0:95-814(+)
MLVFVRRRTNAKVAPAPKLRKVDIEFDFDLPHAEVPVVAGRSRRSSSQRDSTPSCQQKQHQPAGVSADGRVARHDNLGFSVPAMRPSRPLIWKHMHAVLHGSRRDIGSGVREIAVRSEPRGLGIGEIGAEISRNGSGSRMVQHRGPSPSERSRLPSGKRQLRRPSPSAATAATAATPRRTLPIATEAKGFSGAVDAATDALLAGTLAAELSLDKALVLPSPVQRKALRQHVRSLATLLT